MLDARAKNKYKVGELRGDLGAIRIWSYICSLHVWENHSLFSSSTSKISLCTLYCTRWLVMSKCSMYWTWTWENPEDDKQVNTRPVEPASSAPESFSHGVWLSDAELGRRAEADGHFSREGTLLIACKRPGAGSNRPCFFLLFIQASAHVSLLKSIESRLGIFIRRNDTDSWPFMHP